jgi:hypothetical protein
MSTPQRAAASRAAQHLAQTAVGPRAVGSFVPRLTRPAFEKYGFSAAALITDWPAIVGRTIAAYASPDRLRWPRLPARSPGADRDDTSLPGATLILAVDPARALDVQYQRREILDRINRHFGYRAIAELRIEQRHFQDPATNARVERIATPSPPAPITTIADEGLRAALERLAEGLARRRLTKA